jgi:phosphopantothenoylcysteine decarboxylase/phosphopantothenate--cysteine ligase
MGYAIAQAAADMGAEVTLVSGISNVAKPLGVHCYGAESAEAMYQTVMSHIRDQHIFISVAAVADYTATPNPEKIKKGEPSLTLNLKRNKDILAEVASLPNAPFCVGFAAESHDLIAHASQKRLAKKLPLLVANLVSESMGGDEATITLLDDTGIHALPRADKKTLAHEILSHLSQLL